MMELFLDKKQDLLVNNQLLCSPNTTQVSTKQLPIVIMIKVKFVQNINRLLGYERVFKDRKKIF